MGSGCVVHVFLTSILAGGERSASHPQLLYPQYPLDRRLGGSQSRSGPHGEKKNLVSPTPRPYGPYPAAMPGPDKMVFMSYNLDMVVKFFSSYLKHSSM
jgi:hypothetical protein